MISTQALALLAILTLGVVYGTDVFFAVVGQTALAYVSDGSITEVMGRVHQYADRRMPLFGVSGIVFTIGLVAVTHSPFCMVALGAELIHLGIYFRVSKPVNETLTAAAIRGESLSNASELQRRWDRVIVPRALLLGIALLGVTVTQLHF